MHGDKLSDDLERAVSALQDPTRRGILLDFYVNRTERTVDDVAKAARVHRTVAFSHLERLAALGYLVTSQLRGKSGKPAKLYQLAERPIEVHYPMRRFELLAALLATSLVQLKRNGVQAARKAGRRYGTSLISQPAGSVQEVLDQLAPLGSEYAVQTGDVVLARNCVFREACRQAPQVICQLHAGLLEGALRQAGIDRHAQAEGSRGAGCSYRVARASTRASARALRPAS